MITVWGRETSSNVQVVMWAIAELGLPHRRIDAGHRYGGLETADFRAMNPNGRIPVLVDGTDPPLWESAACLRYLAARYGDAAFWPADPAARARLDIWAEWMKTTFIPPFNYGVFWQLVRTPAARRDPAAIATATAETAAAARILDARIGAGPFLGGEAFSFADIMVGHMLYRYFTVPFERAETPDLAAWYHRLTLRPAYARHVMVSYEPLRED